MFKSYVTTALLTVMLSTQIPAESMAGELTVATWGGSYTQKQREAIIAPFTASSGINVLDAPYSGGLGQIRAMIDAGNTTWDVVQLGGAETINACAEGLIQPLDQTRLKHVAEFDPTSVSECGIGAAGWSLIIGYNTKLLGSEPKGWADFWDVKTFPGKRAMRREAKYNLEAALMADGVQSADVYKVLGTPEGVDRAFKKLDELKPNIQWWETGAQPAEWLGNGTIAMSTSFIGRILEAKVEGAPVGFVWSGGMYSVDNWAIVANAKNQDAAYDFLNFATSAESQAAFSRIQPVAPVNLKSVALLPNERTAIMPVGDNLAFRLNQLFWNDNLEVLTERFNAWLAR